MNAFQEDYIKAKISVIVPEQGIVKPFNFSNSQEDSMVRKWYTCGAVAVEVLIGLSIISSEVAAAQGVPPVTSQPFTVSMVYIGLLGDATTTPPTTKLFARNSAGSTV